MIRPDDTRRLFPGLAARDDSRMEITPFVIGRLLEEGDSADLRWLCAEAGEAQLTDWLEARGERQLSKRSRAFWSLILAPRDSTSRRPETEDNPLWPF